MCISTCLWVSDDDVKCHTTVTFNLNAERIFELRPLVSYLARLSVMPVCGLSLADILTSHTHCRATHSRPRTHGRQPAICIRLWGRRWGHPSGCNAGQDQRLQSIHRPPVPRSSHSSPSDAPPNPSECRTLIEHWKRCWKAHTRCSSPGNPCWTVGKCAHAWSALWEFTRWVFHSIRFFAYWCSDSSSFQPLNSPAFTKSFPNTTATPEHATKRLAGPSPPKWANENGLQSSWAFNCVPIADRIRLSSNWNWWCFLSKRSRTQCYMRSLW